MTDREQKEKLSKLILISLKDSSKPLLAKEIATKLNKSLGLKLKRKDINSCLFGAILRGKLEQDQNFGWSIGGGNSQAQEIKPPSKDQAGDQSSPHFGISVQLVKRDQKFTFKTTTVRLK